MIQLAASKEFKIPKSTLYRVLKRRLVDLHRLVYHRPVVHHPPVSFSTCFMCRLVHRPCSHRLMWFSEAGTGPLEVTIGDWLVVRYSIQGSRKTLAFIGQLESVKKGRFWAVFMRPYYTKNHNGFVYCAPQITDRSSFDFSHIVQKLALPENYLREGLYRLPINAATLRNM